MKEAIGGVFTLQIILAFILLVNAYLAYSVNYTRAFRVKNGIISIIEEYEGLGRDAKEKISNYRKKMKYSVPAATVATVTKQGFKTGDCNTLDGYCIKCTPANSKDATSDEYRGVYYSVITFVNIDVPILNKFIQLGSFLQVKGETKVIYSPNGCQTY